MDFEGARAFVVPLLAKSECVPGAVLLSGQSPTIDMEDLKPV